LTDSEQIKLYAELLWWVLALLAAFSPLALAGIIAMARPPFGSALMQPRSPPPTFEKWLAARDDKEKAKS
jgi:hypothetical protein